MKFIYFGSSEFSRIVLENLYNYAFVPSLIVSQPDKPKGRGLELTAMEVSLFALSKKIPLIKPLSLKSEAIKKKIENEMVDLFIVADYGNILPADLLRLPKIFSIALHPSLLPRYRGAAPINWALINGEDYTGITIFKMNEKIDSGEIILQDKIPIKNEDNIVSLHRELAASGAKSLIKAIESIDEGSYSFVPQDEGYVSYAPKLTKKDGRIDWKDAATKIRNLIRATLNWPCAYTYYKNKLIKILDADVITEETNDPASIIVKIDKQGIYVATANGLLKIKKLKPQDKKEMDAYSFVLGHKVKVGDKFS